MKGEKNRLCFCDCEGFVVDDRYYDFEKGIFGWCKIRNMPITKTETYRDKCDQYSYLETPEDQKNVIWPPRIGRWLEVHQKYNKYFENIFKPSSPASMISRIFHGKSKWDNVCPSCYGEGRHGCIHMSCRCETCKGYGGYND